MKKLFIIAIAFLLISSGAFFLLSQKQEEQIVTPSQPLAAGSFDKCVEEGGEVMESYPMQCRDALGNLYVQEIELEKTDVAQKVIETLAVEKGVDALDITVLEYEQRDWPDGCLGIADEDTMCTMAIVPGYYVKLTVQDTEYSYRTNMDGSLIVLEE